MPFDGSNYEVKSNIWNNIVSLFSRNKQSNNCNRQALEILVNAKTLITNNWLRGEYNKDGAFCIVGAIRAAKPVYENSGYRTAHKILTKIAKQRNFNSIEKMNDLSTYKQVLSALDQAIAIVS